MLNIGQLSGAAFFSRVFDSSIIREDLLSQNATRQLSALQQVIAFMTIGRDMSSHFSDIAPLCSSNNLTIKRLVYLYLMQYSRTQPQKAVLQAGAFVKDTLNDSPLIRGTALRTMTSLLVPVMVDFITAPLLRCLEDSDPYVRRIAAFGTLKLYYVAPNVCEEVGLLEKLKNQLCDENAIVVASAVAAILELRQLNAPVDLEEAIVKNVNHLLEAISDTTGWYQYYLLEGVALVFKNSFSTLSMDEVKKIIDSVLPFLSVFNVATIMSAVRVITSFLIQVSPQLLSPSSTTTTTRDENNQELVDMQERCSLRVVGTCVSLLYGPYFEVRFTVFRNIHLLIKTGLSRFFKKYLSVFFVKYDDPIFIKLEKVELLLELADNEVGEVVLSEFVTYATDADEEMVRKAVRSIGFLAAKSEPLASQCVEKLIGLIDTGVNYVVQDAAIVVQTVLRRYPGRFPDVVPKLCDALDILTTAEAKAAVAWVLGEYSQSVEKLHDVLSVFVECFPNEHSTVQLAVLTAVVKIYLQDNSNKKNHNAEILQQVLAMATQSGLPDVRDRAYMYWRLVTSDIEAAKKLILTSSSTLFTTVNNIEKNRLHTLLLDLGNLTSVLHRPLHLIYNNGLALGEKDDDYDDNYVDDDGKKHHRGNDNLEKGLFNSIHPDEDTIISSSPREMSEDIPHRNKEDMHIALPANEGNGLEVSMSWSQLGNKLLLNCRFSLLPGEDYVQRIHVNMLQINRNIFALGLAQQCPTVQLEVGQKGVETVHILAGTNNEKAPSRDLLAAVNADPIGTRYFIAPPVPPAMLLLPATGCDSVMFMEQFRALKAPSWTIPQSYLPVQTNPSRYTAGALRLHGLSLVYTGKSCEGGVIRLFLFAQTISAQNILMELSIQNDIVAYLGVRCKDNYITPVFGAYTLQVLSSTTNS
ncbi:Ap-2 complex subunit beta [Trypanosoma theileri]|uniref:AP complex subunit beta n=1 Tax=Trypanosoma theileri TaxID=67003 RepID=A0A1X0NUY1_9TRYP|nr:Ap-2 complex subunit beta [Trypanosoma theileri]ORC88505.1 Ap-2 complex subunit beta [Trypanosoma theileri]